MATAPVEPRPAKSRWPRRLAWGLAIILLAFGILFLALRTPDIPVAELRAKYGSPASQYVTLAPGMQVHLRDEGPRDGFPIVLLHGSSASLHTWEPWVSRLKDKYRVISFDFPAHGLSGPIPSHDYSAQSYVDITRKVADHLGLTRFALAGNSMGGGVAWRYTAAHPDKVAALILIDASGQPKSAGASRPLGFRIIGMPIVRDLAAIITPRRMIETSFKQTISVQSIATPAMIDRYWELLRYPGNRKATLERFAAARPADDTASLRTITAPTLMLWGREDHLIPVSSAA
ncbi:alpha/beta hydrolase [Polymorphobacter glacialis]|uniref:Alpha/beta hydrolase n=1 Tax=Sandarakinorhabdus glacialis TaxID=1614636 RepID=A0A917E5Z3_9SPHN|nr:alpha/beta hydrolase [Polymorphobacter glacialis]GGE08045.1 alpha/beta hydrolase [Polymorphobacter glacialis]